MSNAAEAKRLVRLESELSRLRKEAGLVPAMQWALRDIRHEAQNAENKGASLNNNWIMERATEGLRK